MGFVGCESRWQRQFLGGLTVVQFMGGRVCGGCGIGGGFVDGGFVTVVWLIDLWWR